MSTSEIDKFNEDIEHRIESLTDDERDLISRLADEAIATKFVDADHIESWFEDRVHGDHQLAYLIGISMPRSKRLEILKVANPMYEGGEE